MRLDKLPNHLKNKLLEGNKILFVYADESVAKNLIKNVRFLLPKNKYFSRIDSHSIKLTKDSFLTAAFPFCDSMDETYDEVYYFLPERVKSSFILNLEGRYEDSVMYEVNDFLGEMSKEDLIKEIQRLENLLSHQSQEQFNFGDRTYQRTCSGLPSKYNIQYHTSSNSEPIDTTHERKLRNLDERITLIERTLNIIK